MPKRINNTPELIRRAAMMRASGASWSSVATELGCHLRRVQAWPREHEAAWKLAYARALVQVEDEIDAEGMHFLRAMMRSKKDQIRRDGVKMLLQLKIAKRKLEYRSATKGEENPSSEAVRLADEVEKINDAELDAHITDLLDGSAPSPGGAGAPSESPPGPDRPEPVS